MRRNGVDEGSLDCNCIQAFAKKFMMGVIVLLFLGIEMKKIGPLLSMETRQCHGIKNWDILGRRVFEHYMVKV